GPACVWAGPPDRQRARGREEAGGRPDPGPRPAHRDRPGGVGPVAGDGERPRTGRRGPEETLRRSGTDARVVQGPPLHRQRRGVRVRHEALAPDPPAAEARPRLLRRTARLARHLGRPADLVAGGPVRPDGTESLRPEPPGPPLS